MGGSRIIFDAFARGLPVLASATTENQRIVDHGRNGLLYRPNDVEALADILIETTRSSTRPAEMDATALREMSARTHAAMHAVRARKIAEAVSKRRQFPESA